MAHVSILIKVMKTYWYLMMKYNKKKTMKMINQPKAKYVMKKSRKSQSPTS